MPKVGKIKSKKAGSSGDQSKNSVVNTYTCMRCGTDYSTQRGNFAKIHSPLYRFNDSYTTVCLFCIDDMYNKNFVKTSDKVLSAKRLCQKLDIYWKESVFYNAMNKSGDQSDFVKYTKLVGLNPYLGRTYDTTIDEMMSRSLKDEEDIPSAKRDIDDKVIDFWGKGLSDEHYEELENRLKNWKGDRDISDFDMGELTVIKQICMLEVQINLDAASGKSIDKNVKALDSLLGSGNLRPVQKKTDDSDGKEDKTPFGVWINRIENDEPIPEPDDEFKDVDGIVKYVSTWFLGHMCKMLKVNNRFSNLYEEELAKLTVERPEYEGDDDEDIVEDIFERANKAAEIASKMNEEDEYDEL